MALVKHTNTTVRVIVQLTTVWAVWTNPSQRGPYQDILQHVTEQDYQRVTVLYVCRNTKTPEAPGNEPQLRRRQRDAALTAWERASSLNDKKLTEWQQVLDDDHMLIYRHAAERLAKIYNNKEHYIHQKPTRQLGKHTKQYKKQLVGQCTRPWQSPQHRWAPHRSGYQCGACGLRVHLDEQYPEQASPHQAMPKKQTRAQVIKNLLEEQAQNQPEPAQHQFEATTGYLRCVKCGTSIHKRVNEAAFMTYLASKCLDQPYTEAHSGHSSHALWQKGEKVSCTQCGLSLHLDGQQRIILTGALKNPCKGAAISGSPPLPELFRKQVEQATQKANSQDDPQGQPLSKTESDRAAYQHPSTAPRLEDAIQASPTQGPN